MTDTDDEKEIRQLMKEAYRTVTPPPCLKDQLRAEVAVAEGDMAVAGPRHSAWERPRIWLPIAIAAVVAVIAYGAWLSVNFTNGLIP